MTEKKAVIVSSNNIGPLVAALALGMAGGVGIPSGRWTAPDPKILNAPEDIKKMDKAAGRKARRALKKLSSVVRGGFQFATPRHYPSVEEPVSASTRPERRRAELGRS